MEEVSICVLKFKFWHWSFVLNDFFSNWILLNEFWILINECISKWLVLRVAPHVHTRNRICYHPLNLYLQKQPLGGVFWKKYSSLPRLHVVDISWSVWKEKGYYHRRLLFFTRSWRLRRGSFSTRFRCCGARNKFKTRTSDDIQLTPQFTRLL